MSKGVINFQIENALKNMDDEDVNENFFGVFPANHMNKFINHAATISEKKRKMPFRYGEYWQLWKGENTLVEYTWYWAEIIFFFYSFVLDGLKHFIIQDERNLIKIVLFGTGKMTRTDNKITPFNIRFHLNACKTLSANELDALSDTASNFFHFIQAFGNKVKLHKFVNKWMVEDRI